MFLLYNTVKILFIRCSNNSLAFVMGPSLATPAESPLFLVGHLPCDSEGGQSHWGPFASWLIPLKITHF